MNIEKEHNGYIGDIVNGLAKEAAVYKTRCLALEERLKILEGELKELKSRAPGIPAEDS